MVKLQVDMRVLISIFQCQIQIMGWESPETGVKNESGS